MTLKELKGKKANEVRWEALKQLDWTKDSVVIAYIFSIQNPRYFSSRTPDEVVADCRRAIDEKTKLQKIAEQVREALGKTKEQWNQDKVDGVVEYDTHFGGWIFTYCGDEIFLGADENDAYTRYSEIINDYN